MAVWAHNNSGSKKNINNTTISGNRNRRWSLVNQKVHYSDEDNINKMVKRNKNIWHYILCMDKSTQNPVNTIECIANLYHPDKNSYAIDPLQMRDTTQKLAFNTSFYRMSREQTAK